MTTLSQQFIAAFERGDVKTAKTLVAHVDIQAEYEAAFRWACYKGHLEVAKWLASQGVNIHAVDEDAFRRACCNGHLEVAEWLVSQGVNIHAYDEDAFRWACHNGHLEVA